MTRQDTIGEFHRLFHASWLDTWANTTWLGVSSEKPPSDLWVYQEIISELRPDFIIETGTRFGGSALFMATVCDAIGHGRVITIDLQPLASAPSCRPEHARITYLTGSSTSPETVQKVKTTVSDAPCVMVVLDSDHGMSHVSDELKLYCDIVTEGSYLIVEDTQFNGHPVAPEFGPGPWEAVEVFLKSAQEFAPDYSREKFLLTFNPRGYLRKNSADGAAARLRAAQEELGVQQRETEELRAAIADFEDRLGRELDALRDQSAERQRQANEEVAVARGRVDEAAAQMGAVRNSASWRLTAPLRRLKTLVTGRTN